MDIDFKALVAQFHADAAEHIEVLEGTLLELEGRKGQRADFESLLRAAHSLKGDAACVGYDVPKQLAHELEDTFEKLRDGNEVADSAVVTQLLNSVDALRSAIAAAEFRAPADIDEASSDDGHGGSGPGGDDGDGFSGANGDREAELFAADRRTHTLRVGIDKLNRMLNLTGEIAIERGRVRRLVEQLSEGKGSEALEAYDSMSQIDAELQTLVLNTRMVPLAATFRKHLRTVRELALTQGKRARLVIEGADVEVDTTIVQQLADPLTHLVRNAMDHGIEPPQERMAGGKDPCGTITLSARHEEGNIVICVSDDGAGIDREAVATHAVEVGLIHDRDELTERRLQEVLFAPGFSTSAEVSEVSGRGVGMDVVSRNVAALRGTITLESEPGLGTSVNLRLPLTLAIMDGFAVGVGDTIYVVPLTSVIECFDLADDSDGTETYGCIPRRGVPLPYVRLRHFFETAGKSPERESVVVVQEQGMLMGLAVDELQGHQQAVVKSLGRLFHKVAGVAGSTIMADGRVALIIDAPTLLKSVLLATEADDASV